jgi:hypothetical protein
MYAASRKKGYKFRNTKSILKTLLRIFTDTFGNVLRIDL